VYRIPRIPHGVLLARPVSRGVKGSIHGERRNAAVLEIRATANAVGLVDAADVKRNFAARK